MKPLLPILAACLLAGCGAQKNTPPAETKADTAAAAPSTVSLDEAAQKSSGVSTEVAGERMLPETIRASARLTNDDNHTWRVGSVTEGRVVRVLAAPGDFVKAGKPLAAIHSHDVHDSRAQLRNSQTELARATSNVQYAQKARDRARRLLDLKAGSVEQVEHAEAELRNAEAALATARTETERNRAHLVEFLGVAEEGGHEHQPGAESDDRDLIPVRAPASGTVITRNVTPGVVVTPATDLFVLSDLSSLWAMAEVQEEHLPRLQPGMPVRVFVQAWPNEPFAGRIGKIGEALDPATRTVKVRVELANRAGRLKPEMYATAEIDIGTGQSAVFVPEEATQEVRGQTAVFVQMAPGKFEVRPVETGRVVNGVVEIRRGLRAGERVVSHGAFVLKSEYLKSALAGE